jgi:hypothetical protein
MFGRIPLSDEYSRFVASLLSEAGHSLDYTKVTDPEKARLAAADALGLVLRHEAHAAPPPDTRAKRSIGQHLQEQYVLSRLAHGEIRLAAISVPRDDRFLADTTARLRASSEKVQRMVGRERSPRGTQARDPDKSPHSITQWSEVAFWPIIDQMLAGSRRNIQRNHRLMWQSAVVASVRLAADMVGVVNGQAPAASESRPLAACHATSALATLLVAYMWSPGLTDAEIEVLLAEQFMMLPYAWDYTALARLANLARRRGASAAASGTGLFLPDHTLVAVVPAILRGATPRFERALSILDGGDYSEAIVAPAMWEGVRGGIGLTPSEGIEAFARWSLLMAETHRTVSGAKPSEVIGALDIVLGLT